MSLLHIALLALALYLVVRFVSKKKRVRAQSPQSELLSLEPWLTEAIERELRRGVRNVEQTSLGKSLRGNPDPDVVSAIEAKVSKVDLEFVHYAHESDADVTVRVHYEDQETGTERNRMSLASLPESVRKELSRGVTRVYRKWDFSWANVS